MENEKIKAITWFDDRFYKTTKEDGSVDYIPSVTTKLGALSKPFLTRWYGQLGTREAELRRDEAADKGTRLHHAWYTYMSGGAVIYDNPKVPVYTKEEIEGLYKVYNNQVMVLTRQDEMYNAMKLQKFVDIVKPKVVANEVILYDLDCRDAGTADNIFDIKTGKYPINGSKLVELPEGRYIFDLKSGASIGKEARMQVATYAKMAEKGNFGRIRGTLIGHTQSKTKTGIEGFSVSYQNEEEIEQEYQDYRDIAKVWERNFGNLKPTIREIPSLISLTKGE